MACLLASRVLASVARVERARELLTAHLKRPTTPRQQVQEMDMAREGGETQLCEGTKQGQHTVDPET